MCSTTTTNKSQGDPDYLINVCTLVQCHVTLCGPVYTGAAGKKVDSIGPLMNASVFLSHDLFISLLAPLTMSYHVFGSVVGGSVTRGTLSDVIVWSYPQCVAVIDITWWVSFIFALHPWDFSFFEFSFIKSVWLSW